MATPSSSNRIFLVAGEVSGDLHGADLARELLALRPDLQLEGVGGPRMAAAGVTLVEDSSTWGVIGWFEAARQLRPFLRRLDEVTTRILEDPPSLLVPIDFPGFNLTLLKRLRGRVRAVYYVPPMVSVRRGRRAARVAALGARLLAIFPFEADAYRAAGADAIFVGHPAVDHMRGVEPAPAVRARLGLAPGAPVVGLLPGSRRQELDSLLSPMLEAGRRLRHDDPAVTFVLGLASPIFRDAVEAAVAGSGLPVTIVNGARDVLAASTVLLTASGTATVEAMLLGVPMVVTYRGSWLSWIYVHLAVKSRWAALPNILAQERLVPELLQGRATADAMSASVGALLRSAGDREKTHVRLLDLAGRLGPPGAAGRAAGEILMTMGMSTLRPI
ncbi:MAG: lipid-A-disaccharide synthase [Armatimonadota bacterium]